MKIIIVGGGKLGFYTAYNMINKDYEVKVIEKDRQRCEMIANFLDAEVICGDGTEIEILAKVGTSKADCFIAVTGKDQDNLVSSQLAKKKFLARKVISRVNNPKNLEIFRKLGIKDVVSSTEALSHLIEQEVEVNGMKLLATLNKGKTDICTVTIPFAAKISSQKLKDINLPEETLIISIMRGENLIIPNGDTMIHPKDEVVALCSEVNKKKLLGVLSELE